MEVLRPFFMGARNGVLDMRCSARGLLAFALGVTLLFWIPTVYAFGVVGKESKETWCSSGGTSPAACYRAAFEASGASWRSSWGSVPSGWRFAEVGASNCELRDAGASAGCTGLVLRLLDAGGNSMGSHAPGWTGARTLTSVCPQNSLGVGSQCQCIEGTKSQGGQCVPNICPGGGSYSKVTQPDVQVGGVGSVCQAGCEANPSGYTTGQDGKIYAHWPFKYSGKNCGGAKDPQGVDQTGDKGFEELPTRCGPKQCPGSFNGQAMCVACKGELAPGDKETAPKPVAPDEPGVDGVKGAERKETSTECSGTACTTTTKYFGSDGGQVGEKKQEKPRESFCKENPELSICKQGSFGGSCQAGFQCEGDAVQCAMAREQHKRSCQWFDDVDQAQIDKGKSAQNDQAQPEGHPFAAASQQSFALSGLIDQSNRITGGCVTDYSFSVMGRPLSLPFSKMCPYLAIMGNIVVGFSLLAAIRIVFS